MKNTFGFLKNFLYSTFALILFVTNINAKEVRPLPNQNFIGDWRDLDSSGEFVVYDETGTPVNGRTAAGDATHARELIGPQPDPGFVPFVFGKRNGETGQIEVAPMGGPFRAEKDTFDHVTKTSQNQDPAQAAGDVNQARGVLEVLSGPTENCDQVQTDNEVIAQPIAPTDGRGLTIGTDPMAQGARKFLATMFQSCDALNNESTLQIPKGKEDEVNVAVLDGVDRRDGSEGPRRITNRSEYIDAHPVLRQLKVQKSEGTYPPSGESCKDATLNPPVYGYGSKANTNSDGALELTELGPGNSGSNGARVFNGVTPQAIDCSGLIAGAMAIQGLKITPQHADGYRIHSTSMFRNTANAATSNTCINHARFSGNDSLLTGDIINVGSSHIVMVDSIGEDPLGINAAVAAGSCEDISVSSFDFTYIHSGAMNSSNTAHIGPSRVHISYHSNVTGSDRPGTMFNNLVNVAQDRCQDIIDGENLEESSSYGRSGNSKFGILRHVVNDSREAITDEIKSNCRMEEPVKLDGAECVDCV